MYYTVDQEVTNQVWADMSLWQEHSLPPSPGTPQIQSRTHLSALCYNNPITAIATVPTTQQEHPQRQQEQQQQQQTLGPVRTSVSTGYDQVPHSQESWLEYVSQGPVSFDDTLRDCINMLSGRKPEIPAAAAATADNLLIAPSQSAPIPTTSPSSSSSSSSYQSAIATPPLPIHNLQHITHQGISCHLPSFPPHQQQDLRPQPLLQIQGNRVKSVTWPSPQQQGPLVDPDTIPRRQKPRYKDDEYSPKWVRYSGHLKEGYCDTCTEGRWLQLKNSAYWYHKQFYHGISSVSGQQFAEPLEQRISSDGVIEGLCHQCGYYVPICNGKRKRNIILWYKHAHKCHIYNKPEKFSPSYRMF